MKYVFLFLCQLTCVFGAATVAAKPPAATSAKLAGLLAAKAPDGKPILSAEQRASFDNLSDYLKGLLVKVVDAEIITRSDHLGTILSLGLRPQKMELLLQNNCVLCHTDPEVQGPGTLFSLAPVPGQAAAHHLNLREVTEDVHFLRGVSCAGCHGGDPTSSKLEHSFVKEWPALHRDQDRAWVVAFCSRCHSDPALMKGFNPALPTDQLAKFKDSPHGKLLLETRDRRAPDCISCHGLHGIRSKTNPLSLVNPKRIDQTCGACHSNPATMAGFKRSDGSPLPTDQAAKYRTSVHGRALLERGVLGAPTCNDCHGSHAGQPTAAASVIQSCGLCHAGNSSLFDGSKHKLAFEQHGWPQCVQCHGDHGIAPTSDAMLAAGPTALCTACHAKFAQDNPACTATAAYFFATLKTMRETRARASGTAEQLAMKGLDVDPISSQLIEVDDSLKQARTHIHAFSKADFARAAAPGEKALGRIAQLEAAAKAEYRRRQAGMAASIALIGLVMVLLYLKLRAMER